MNTPVIAIFDIGKTNKKLFLFDENYQTVYERSATFPEIRDEDGFPCDNIEMLRNFVFESLSGILQSNEFNIKAINFTTYGASFIYIDKEGKPLTPLYNYLKPYDPVLHKQFYDTYGGMEPVSLSTASPVLGNLNSGMQLYRLKHQHPDVFARVAYALHLPQYMSFLVTGKVATDITSIGCHTGLWDFSKNDYHEWVYKEQIDKKLAPLMPSDTVTELVFQGKKYNAGIGLHDSSAALIPYLVSFPEPFVLISTGTWCISMNSFNDAPLTKEELRNDCLAYLSYKRQPVKASRLFAGYEHEQQVKRIAAHFNENAEKYKAIPFQPQIIEKLSAHNASAITSVDNNNLQSSVFAQRDLATFESSVEAYHQLMIDIVKAQKASTELIMSHNITKIFVDGGFSKNQIYMKLLANSFSTYKVFSASVAQATATGAALAIHNAWNSNPVPENIIECGMQ